MELIETIMVAMMAGMSKTIIDMIWAIFQSLVYMAINVSIIDDYSHMKHLDVYLATRGICLIRNFNHTRTPESGYHFVVSWKWNIIPTGFLVAHKGSDNTTVYWVGPGMHDLRIQIIGDPNMILERAITMLSASNPSVMFRQISAPEIAMSWQTKIVESIASDFNKTCRSSWIVCGPPGCGKSTLGLLVAKRLIAPSIRPVLCTGVDFVTPGLSIRWAYHYPCAATPVILLLNELDSAIRHAERDPDKDSTGARETTCIANTPTVMLNTLDYIMSTPHLIVIATTNMKQSELVTGIYQRYTRAGRFDNHYQVRENEAGRATKPRRGRAKKSLTA